VEATAPVEGAPSENARKIVTATETVVIETVTDRNGPRIRIAAIGIVTGTEIKTVGERVEEIATRTETETKTMTLTETKKAAEIVVVAGKTKMKRHRRTVVAAGNEETPRARMDGIAAVLPSGADFCGHTLTCIHIFHSCSLFVYSLLGGSINDGGPESPMTIIFD